MRTPVRYEAEEGPEKLSSQGKYCGNAVVLKSNAKKIHDEQNTKILQTGFNRTGIGEGNKAELSKYRVESCR